MLIVVGVSVVSHVEDGQVGGRRHEIVHEVVGQRIAEFVVADVLVQRLRDTLRDAPVLLAFDDDRVDDAAAVVDRDEAHEIDRAGFGVDFDHRGVHAVGKRRAVLVDVGAGAEMTRRYERRDVRWQRARVRWRRVRPRTTRRCGSACRRRRAGHLAVTTMSRGSASSRWAAIAPRLNEHFATGDRQRAAGQLQRPRRAGAVTSRHERGVGRQQVYRFERDTEDSRQDQAPRRRVALAVIARAGAHVDPYRVVRPGLDIERGVFAGTVARRHIQPQRDTDAERQGIAPRSTLRLLLAERLRSRRVQLRGRDTCDSRRCRRSSR